MLSSEYVKKEYLIANNPFAVCTDSTTSTESKLTYEDKDISGNTKILEDCIDKFLFECIYSNMHYYSVTSSVPITFTVNNSHHPCDTTVIFETPLI